jgi:ribonuclease D
LFHSARWKFYLQQIQIDAKDNKREETDSISELFHKIHAQQSALFAKPPDNGHQAAAEEHLRRSEELMKDCTEQVDALEETLANTPKPSEMLNWGAMTLGDMLGQG